MNVGQLLQQPWQSVQRYLFDHGWQSMDTAPKDQPILGYCMDESEPDEKVHGCLSTYLIHRQELDHVVNGPHVLVWGGEYGGNDPVDGTCFTIPNWWFRYGSAFEEPAAPIAWKPVI